MVLPVVSVASTPSFLASPSAVLSYVHPSLTSPSAVELRPPFPYVPQCCIELRPPLPYVPECCIELRPPLPYVPQCCIELRPPLPYVPECCIELRPPLPPCLQVNDEDISGYTRPEVADLLRNCQGKVVLCVSRQGGEPSDDGEVCTGSSCCIYVHV